MTRADLAPSDAPTTVVHLITTLSQGGAERVLSQVVPRPPDVPLDDTGRPTERHVVVTLVDGGMFADELQDAGVEVRGLGMRPGRDVVRGTLRLAALLRELRPTMVVSWMYHACLLDLLARPFAGTGRRARMVWNLRGSLHSTETMARSTRWVVRGLARRSSVPDAIAINSAAGRSDHVAAGYRPRRWIHLPNGCDVERFRPDPEDRDEVRRELGLVSDDTAILFVGRAHPEKGFDVLLEAARMLDVGRPVTVVLAGSGTDALAAGEVVMDVRTSLIGLGVRDDVDRLLRGADLLVLPSRSEGTPNAVIEAMATGLPCIVSDVGDCAALVGDTGFVVVPGSPGSLAAGLEQAITTPLDERQTRGAAARDRVIERHSLVVARSCYAALWRTDAP